MAPYWLLAGLSLLASGITALLAKPPPSIPFNGGQFTPPQGPGDISGSGGGPSSYLFNGPVNLIGEGGPVPVGYGKLLVGSTVVLVNINVLYLATRRPRRSATSLQELQEGGVQFLFNEHMMLMGQKPTSAGIIGSNVAGSTTVKK